MTSLLLLLAAIVIASLAIYAYRLTMLVKQQESQRAKALAIAEEKQEKQTAYITESLQVIAANVIDENLNLSEATIRCKMLLDALLLTPQERQPYAILDEVFDQVGSFATHQSRKDLTAQQRLKQDSQRVAIEEKYSSELMVCFKLLRTFTPPSRSIY